MKVSLKKFTATAVCVSMLLSSGIYASPVFAERYLPEMIISSVKEGNAYIPEGTILHVKLAEELSSRTAKVGDPVLLRLVGNLIVNGVIVAPRGSKVKGIVTKARKAGGLGRGGKLEFMIVSLTTLNGVDIPLQYTKYQHGANDGGAVAVFVLVSMVGGAFMKGKNVVFNPGLKFDVEVTADTDLECSIYELEETMERFKPRAVVVNQIR